MRLFALLTAVYSQSRRSRREQHFRGNGDGPRECLAIRDEALTPGPLSQLPDSSYGDMLRHWANGQ